MLFIYCKADQDELTFMFSAKTLYLLVVFVEKVARGKDKIFDFIRFNEEVQAVTAATLRTINLESSIRQPALPAYLEKVYGRVNDLGQIRETSRKPPSSKTQNTYFAAIENAPTLEKSYTKTGTYYLFVCF